MIPRFFFIATLFLYVSCKTLHAQPIAKGVPASELKGRAKDNFEKGKANMTFEPKQAITELSACLRLEPLCTEAWFLLGGVYYDEGDFSMAIGAFRKALEIDSLYSPDLNLFLGKTYMEVGKFDEAVVQFDAWKKHPKYNPRNVNFRAAQLPESARLCAEMAKNPVPFNAQRLSEAINTPSPEYLPSISADGLALVFTRREKDENYFMSKYENGAWTEALAIDSINTPGEEGGQTISADGKTIIFTRCNASTSCDLWITQWKNNGWKTPIKLPGELNTKSWESQPSLSPNGKQLYFTSDRPGGVGGADLWVSDFDGTRFTAPRNLGPKINTPGQEITPFIHVDGKTFYFSSDGLPGFGKYDMFVTALKDDSTFEEPRNLGYPINTTAREDGLIVARDGKTAFYVHENKADNARTDIYSFELPSQARAKPTTYVRISVRDAETKLVMKADISVRRLSDGQVLLQAPTRSDGSALACLPVGESYSLLVNQTGYIFHSENFTPAENSINAPYQLDVLLQPLGSVSTPSPVNEQPIVLRNVFFDTGSATLRNESHYELDQLADLLQKTPSLRIEIRGHTDNVGKPETNLQLSESRAKSVYNYLVAKGIDANRLSFKGFGETQPVTNNDTPENRQQNRRTEFIRI